jgi:sarcosine oxidase subunit beta
MIETADAVVIGGGVIGASILYYLAKSNVNACLVERGDIASGTSGRCDGNVMASDSTPGYDSDMAKLGAELFPGLANELDYDVHWSNRGSLIVFENEEEAKVGKEHARKLKERGVPVRLFDQKEVHEDEPYLAPDIVGGMETACDGALDPISLTIGLVMGAKKLGATVCKYTKVTGIDRNGKAGFVVRTDKNDIATPVVINAAGVWTADIGNMVGLDIPIRPRQGQILVAEQTFRVARRKIMEFGYLMAKYSSTAKRNVTPDMEKYGVALVYEPTHVNNFLLGSSRQFVGFDVRSNYRIMRAIAQRGIRFFPVMKDINIIRSYAGVRPFCVDHLPIVSDTQIPGFYIASGHEGNGIGLSLVTGTLISQMICGEKLIIDPTPLSFFRFENQIANVSL